MGFTVNFNDFSIHTLLAVSEYAGKVMKNDGKNTVPPKSLSELQRESKRKV